MHTAEDIQTARAQRRADSDNRLAAAVEYVAIRLSETGDSYRGAVKLNKLIWWADTESYRRNGYTVTGSDYQRLPQGPVPYRLPPVRAHLMESDRVVLLERELGARRPEKILAPGPRSDVETVRQVLTAADIGLLDESLAKFFGWTGTQVSEFSHQNSRAWQTLDDGDLIPSADALLGVDVPDLAADELRRMLVDNGLA